MKKSTQLMLLVCLIASINMNIHAMEQSEEEEYVKQEVIVKDSFGNRYFGIQYIPKGPTDPKYKNDKEKVENFKNSIEYYKALQLILLKSEAADKLEKLIDLETNTASKKQFLATSLELACSVLSLSSMLQQKMNEFLTANSDLHEMQKSHIKEKCDSLKSGDQHINNFIEKITKMTEQ